MHPRRSLAKVGNGISVAARMYLRAPRSVLPVTVEWVWTKGGRLPGSAVVPVPAFLRFPLLTLCVESGFPFLKCVIRLRSFLMSRSS